MSSLRVHPAGADRWQDLATLFGPNGAYSGCWCMFLRTPSKVFNENCVGGGAANRDALAGALLHVLTDSGHRAELVSSGRAQAACFTWEKAAQQLLLVYKRFGGGSQ